jgi:PAS domain S-box-containing protein
MWVYDVETLAFLAVNAAATRYYGYSDEEFRRMTLRDLRPAEGVPALERAIAALTPESGPLVTTRHRTREGRLIDVEVSSHALEFDGRSARLALITDVTERLQLEAQLRQAQKMEAVGRLAGGVAHDFNNLLTIVKIHSEFLRERIAESHPEREDVEEIYKAADRAAALTRQLLAFSRQQVLRPRELDLNTTVAELHKMLARLVGEDVTLLLRLQSDLGAVLADPGQMEQVIVNLVVNARDAMPAGGEVTIETRNVELGPADLVRCPQMTPGPYVMLVVADTGVGMDDATKARIFEPFFTTKEPGRGTGLGLSTVYGIVKQSEGYVWVSSQRGHGTSVTVYLPRVLTTAHRAEPAPAADGNPGGRETILLVEDEAGVRALARRILHRQGYCVLEARDGQDAIDVAATFDGRIDLVLTDVVMPGMSGPDLATELIARQPGLRVIYMSGYTEDTIVYHGVLNTGIAFLHKPFTADALGRKVREVLER